MDFFIFALLTRLRSDSRPPPHVLHLAIVLTFSSHYASPPISYASPPEQDDMYPNHTSLEEFSCIHDFLLSHVHPVQELQ